MQYKDTSFGDENDTVAKWLQELNPQDIEEFRLQSGYFHGKAVYAIQNLLHALREEQKNVSILIGANDCDTLYSDICDLATCIGLPRAGGRLGVVAFDNALFHPKVYHVKMSDGTQKAFVGSANFTEAGIAGLNIEAGVSLDSSDDSNLEVLERMAETIDRWFERNEDQGFYKVEDLTDAEALRERGILSVSRPTRQRRPTSAEKGSDKLTRRKVLISLPAPEESEEDYEEEDGIDETPDDAEPPGTDGGGTQEAEDDEERVDDPSAEEEEQTPTLPCVTLPGFPDYLLFAPDAEDETSGYEALSSLPLPKGAVGLVMKLKPATARKFTGGKGTADINIPIKAIKTIRFGRKGKHERPCAKVLFKVRYISTSETDQAQIVMPQTNTRIQGYGYTSEETGHRDLRMTLPTRTVEHLKTAIEDEGFTVPAADDLFLLEWPNSESDCFGLTFLGRGSEEEATAKRIYKRAVADNSALGDMCWLPPNSFPGWGNP